VEEEKGSRGSAFGDLLRRHRLNAGLSQETLAERARMSVRGLGALERGDRRTPQRETLALLADALRLGAEERRAFEVAGDPRGSRRGARGTVTAGPWEAAPVSNLPLALTRFVGREPEVDEIVALLREHRLVTLTGPGGIGKTRTALESGAALNEADGGGVWLADLALISDASRVVAAIATPLGVQEAPNASLLDVLLAFLERKPVVILLDNCEHVIEEVRRVATALLQRCRNVRILATSRESLRLPSERRYVLAPLNVPPERETLSASRLLAFDGPALFADRATAADARFALTDENAAQVAEICRRLDGMPLALELAAPRVRMFTLHELGARLGDRFKLLTGGDRTALPRQRTIRALIDWSYDLLGEDERELFRMLSIFAGGFTLATATAVRALLGADADATVELLSSLVDKSLVQVEPGERQTRYRLLESIQQYAAERLAEGGEHDAVARAHAQAFLALAGENERLYGTASDDEWKAQAGPEIENWRAALAWSLVARGDVPLGIALTAALRWVWIAYADVEGREWTAKALAAAGPSTPPAVMAGLHLADAHVGARLSAYKVSYDAAQRALAYVSSEVYPDAVAEAEWRIGAALVMLGDPAAGEARLRSSLAAYRALAFAKNMCWVLVCVAMARANQQDVAEAKACYAEALAIAKERGLKGVAMVVLGNLAEAEFRDGNPEGALRCAREALDGARSVQSMIGPAYHLCNMTSYLIALGRFDEARETAQDGLDCSRDVHADVLTVLIEQHIAAIAALDPHTDAGTALERRERAARLLGYVDARFATFEVTREPTDAQEYEAVRAALDGALGTARAEALMREGRAWSDDHALAQVEAL
jgi:predicted ATPase/DNA-binding XRE family transcriptional regulator